jgi:hypothetical protein
VPQNRDEGVGDVAAQGGVDRPAGEPVAQALKPWPGSGVRIEVGTARRLRPAPDSPGVITRAPVEATAVGLRFLVGGAKPPRRRWLVELSTGAAVLVPPQAYPTCFPRGPAVRWVGYTLGRSSAATAEV